MSLLALPQHQHTSFLCPDVSDRIALSFFKELLNKGTVTKSSRLRNEKTERNQKQSTILINSSLSAPTKIEELTAGSEEKKNTAQPRRGAALCFFFFFFFSSDPAVSSSIFVGAEREELIRNDPDKSECTKVQFWKNDKIVR